MATPIDADLAGERKRVYRFIERHGPVQPSTVAERVGIDPESFQHHVTILQRDELVEEDDRGRLRERIHRGEAEEFAEAGVAYTIRPARPADLSGVVGAIRNVTAEDSYLPADPVAAELEYEGTVFRQSPTECRAVFVATVEDDVVGWVHVAGQEGERLRGTAQLTLGVLDGYRRHGIGSHLLQRGVGWAASREFRKVYNSLPATNGAAVAFLVANGWTREAVRPDHYEVDGELVDEVMLARRLDDD